MSRNTPETFDVNAWYQMVYDVQHEPRPEVVCLCGSTQFADLFHEVNLKETLAGRIVLSIGCDTKSDRDLLLAGELTEADKIKLDKLHLHKITLANRIIVLNKNGKVGNSTRGEIAYAVAQGIPISWYDETNIPDWFTNMGVYVGEE